VTDARGNDTSDPRRLPVTIVSGFLGSGKTTLVNHLLANAGGRKIAVLVNEFGDLGIDGELIESNGQPIVELANGCICCTINDDLLQAAHAVLERTPDLDHMVVETTGLADPLPVAQTFRDTELKNLTRVDSIITLIDVENFDVNVDRSMAAANQIQYGDVLVLNKIDLVSAERLAEVELRLKLMRNGARLLRSTRGRIDPAVLLFASAPAGAAVDHSDCAHEHGSCRHDQPHESHLDHDGFNSVSFATDRAFDPGRFDRFLKRQLPHQVFRGKGIIQFENSATRHIMHLCGQRLTIEEARQGGKGSRLVFIGVALDGAVLKENLGDCLI
jgi:G3E family GTPase